MSSHFPFSDAHINFIEEECEFLNPLHYDPLDDSWSLLYQEILQPPAALATPPQIITNSNSAAVNDALENGSKSMKIGNPNYPKSTRRKKNSNQNAAEDKKAVVISAEADEEGPACSSAAKKLDHNAKERIRRMKLNASFLALRALLPDSRRSKKRWSAPATVDKALKYIPELENEVEKLKSKKLENLQLLAAKTKKINNPNIEDEYPISQSSVSVNKVNQEEAIIQICMAKEDHGLLAFTNLLQSVEDEGICINSASMNYVCDTRICYNLHIQTNQSSSEAHYIEELRDKIISWLRQ